MVAKASILFLGSEIPTTKPPSKSGELHNDMEYFSSSIDKNSNLLAYPHPKSAFEKSNFGEPETPNLLNPANFNISDNRFSKSFKKFSLLYTRFLIRSAIASAAATNPSSAANFLCSTVATPQPKQFPK